MKKFSKIMFAVFAALISMAFVSFNAHAETYDMGMMESGKTYSFPQFATVIGQFTPSETGPVRIVYTNSILALYSSPSHDENSLIQGSHSYFSGGRVMTYASLEGGKTYYLYSAMAMDSSDVTIYEGSQELKVVSISPSPDPSSSDYTGGKFSVSDNYRITVEFNFPVNIGNTFLIVGDQRELITASVYGTAVSCEVAQPIMQFYHTGVLKEGDTMTLRILGVSDALDPTNKYEEMGKFEVDYVMAAKPVELVRVINAFTNSAENVFHSFYFPDDPKGKVSFVFDGPLSTSKEPNATLTYGNTDNIEVGIYTEEVTGTNEGDTSVFDFTGKLRRPVDMLPNATPETQPDYLYISFGDVFSADGQRAFTNSVSNPNTFGLSFKINTLQYSLAADYTPARETPLQPGTPMEIWVMNGNKITFEGIAFNYIKDGKENKVVVPYSQIKAEHDPYSADAMLYNLTIPDYEGDENTDVVVSFENLMCADGIDHSSDLVADFKAYSAGIGVTIDNDNPVDVYNAAGVRVLKGVDAGQFSNLEKGLYIINGQKFIRH